jgi:DNA-binding transcriptional regulator YiaG
VQAGDIAGVTEKQKAAVKQTAQKLYHARRITLEMAVWAMKNAGYSRKETAEWLEISKEDLDEWERNNE